jgi:hypothetical protein
MTRHMTQADVLAAAQARLLSALVVTNARTLVSIPGVGPEFWAAYGNLRGAVQRLDDEVLTSTIATSEQIVRTGPVYDLPCGHTVFDACEACTPDPDTNLSVTYMPADQFAAVEAALDEPPTVIPALARAAESAALTEHEAGVDAFVSRPEFGGAK